MSVPGLPEVPMGICAVCGDPASRWCDAVLGWYTVEAVEPHAVEDEPRRLVDTDRLPPSCDVGLCAACAVQVGHVCGHDEQDEPWMDTIDYCPWHAEIAGDEDQGGRLPHLPQAESDLAAVETARRTVEERLVKYRPYRATLIPFRSE